MARKSRKNQSPNGGAVQICIRNKVGIYVRLSVEDNGYATKGSIENQIELLKQYIEAHADEMELVEIYIDNGSTGTNFHRDAWKDLIADLKAGRVDCVIVKDFSRLGRNYIEVGNYLEKIFPFLGIRVIAVNENFDSKIHQFNEKMLLSSLTNIVNEYYARDISAKVTQTKRSKQKRGEFNGCVPPYGYLHSETDRTKLVCDPETADIVQRIFEWRVQGKGCLVIARYLNELLIPSPGLYRYRLGYKYFKKCVNSKWQSKHVVAILSNPIYLGNMVQGKTRTSYFVQEGKIVYLPKEEWIVVEHTHEPLITVEQFQMAARLAEMSKERHNQQLKANENVSKVDNPFARKVYCGQCGRMMTRRNRVVKASRDYCFYCSSTNKKLDGHCKNTHIHEEPLTQAIRKSIEMQFQLLGTLRNEWRKKKQAARHENMGKKSGQGIIDLENKIALLIKQKNDLYADVQEGILSKDEYSYAREHMNCEIEKYKEELERAKQEKEQDRRLSTNMEAYQEIVFSLLEKEITFELIDRLVDKIVVYSPERIEITFSFDEQVQRVLNELKARCE